MAKLMEMWALAQEFWQWFVVAIGALAGILGITAKTRYDAKAEAAEESKARADEIIEQGRVIDADVSRLPDDAALDELRRDWSDDEGTDPTSRR